MALAYYEYTIRSGDSLSRIIYDMYGWNPNASPAPTPTRSKAFSR